MGAVAGLLERAPRFEDAASASVWGSEQGVQSTDPELPVLVEISKLDSAFEDSKCSQSWSLNMEPQDTSSPMHGVYIEEAKYLPNYCNWNLVNWNVICLYK